MSKAELKRRWRERRRLVQVPDGHVNVGDRCFKVSLPDVVAIEETQDLRMSKRQIFDGTPRRAHLVKRRADYALYRIDEPVDGRSASGHWVTGPDGLVLTAITMVPFPGMAVKRAS